MEVVGAILNLEVIQMQIMLDVQIQSMEVVGAILNLEVIQMQIMLDFQIRESPRVDLFLYEMEARSQSSQKQDVVALSTTEAEYIALANEVKDAIWIRRFLNELGIPMDYVSIYVDNQSGIRRFLNELGIPMDYVSIYVDNQSAIKLASNPEFHKRSKHLLDRFMKGEK
ncbi:hypothetical protein QE152_g7337 [Popillia japonica]|uniref:Polyprotein n=1 Tax=Popillia japonica TaxID=7064 RepID=A0AAW1MFD1_POPJA